jgi:hypothetical protein
MRVTMLCKTHQGLAKTHDASSSWFQRSLCIVRNPYSSSDRFLNNNLEYSLYFLSFTILDKLLMKKK